MCGYDPFYWYEYDLDKEYEEEMEKNKNGATDSTEENQCIKKL